MATHYAPRDFLRRVSNSLLKEYFKNKNLLRDVDFDSIKQTKIEPIFEAFLHLSDDNRNKIEQDFQEIHNMSNEGGLKSLIDEAQFNGENLIKEFDDLELLTFQDKVMWVFLNKHDYWFVSVLLYQTNRISPYFWRKRKNVPQIEIQEDHSQLERFEQALGSYFHNTQGRGNNCKVEYYKRDDRDYFFAYPEDYSRCDMEWKENKISRRFFSPTFDLMFVYSQNDTTLDVYIKGEKRPIPDLQNIFAKIILEKTLGEEKKDNKVYDLCRILDQDFEFKYTPQSGITNVCIDKLQFLIKNTDKRITLEISDNDNKQAIYDFLDQTTHNVPRNQLFVIQIELKVTFTTDHKSNKTKTRRFKIGYPNSCSHRHDGRDKIIRQMLIDSGIEPREPKNKDGN